MTNSLFPKHFLWGASTAAHQVEGGNHNQWTVWERANAERLAANAPERYRHLPNWPAIKEQVCDPHNYISGNGIEHYSRYAEDFKLVKALGLNTFRFGIEWSRLEPREGEWDDTAIAHYRTYIAALRKQHIEPVLTLWHWTMPTWFTDKGAFEKRQNLHYWRRYVKKVCDELGAGVSYVLTLNEPNVYASVSYMEGRWPPQKHNALRMLGVYGNLARAHRQAYEIWKKRYPKARVSIAAQLANGQPRSRYNPLDRLIVCFTDYLWNWWFLDRTRGQLDFIGLNYYFTQYLSWRGLRNPAGPLNDLGWYMEPRGTGRLLQAVWRRYKKPIIITENGVADTTDTHRQWWIAETMQAMQDALRAGVQLEGYLHWSLLDNFEWSDGWWPHFGLIAVDRTTMQRTIRPSARWFAEQIKKL